jgi:hypothetical protein
VPSLVRRVERHSGHLSLVVILIPPTYSKDNITKAVCQVPVIKCKCTNLSRCIHALTAEASEAINFENSIIIRLCQGLLVRSTYNPEQSLARTVPSASSVQRWTCNEVENTTLEHPMVLTAIRTLRHTRSSFQSFCFYFCRYWCHCTVHLLLVVSQSSRQALPNTLPVCLGMSLFAMVPQFPHSLRQVITSYRLPADSAMYSFSWHGSPSRPV